MKPPIRITIDAAPSRGARLCGAATRHGSTLFPRKRSA
jgi:hypothetical protein